METLKAILTRRSIRKYSEKNIPEEYYEILLRAAMHAPSGTEPATLAFYPRQ